MIPGFRNGAQMGHHGGRFVQGAHGDSIRGKRL
jgi:hypothetical protein